MKIMNSKLLVATLVGLFSTVLFISCEDETPAVPEPEASFTSEVSGKTVTFTNTSTDGVSYSWNFGDDETSTDENPTHTYAGNGSYVVTLTATNASGSDDSQAVLEIINISIDGDFSDWDDVAAVDVAGGGTVTGLKIENLGNTKLYLYVEGTADMTDLTQIMLNTDNDKTTGAFIDWVYNLAGEDVLIEGAMPTSDDAYASVYLCAPCDGSAPGNWNWAADPVLENRDDFIVASELATVSGGKAYELSIDLTALTVPIASDGIGIGYVDVSLDTWGPVGALPALYNENDNPTGTLYDYVFK